MREHEEVRRNSSIRPEDVSAASRKYRRETLAILNERGSVDEKGSVEAYDRV